MIGLGRLALLQAAALASMMEPPKHQQVIVIDNPPVEPDEVFAFYGDSSGAFRTSEPPRRKRPAIFKPNGAREVERRRRQREKRETRLLSSTDRTEP